jgi:hypothetical protein
MHGMPDVVMERALFQRDSNEAPQLLARSPALADALITPIIDILIAFGPRPPGAACRGAVFARPLDVAHVAVVQVDAGSLGPTSLRYCVIVLSRSDYAVLGGDPLAIARRTGPPDPAGNLDAVRLPAEPIEKRGVEQVCAVLQRVKTDAPPGDVDAPLTVDNAESPTLLGGVQALVDGGRLAFERSEPDASLIAALWMLLPSRLRPQLWPATFAFSNALGFDVVVLPRGHDMPCEGYVFETPAGEYPPGNYEIALQVAAESGDEKMLAEVLASDPKALEPTADRRAGDEARRLGAKLFLGLALFVAASHFLTRTNVDPAARAATAAGVVGVGDPWAALYMLDSGNRLFLKR